MPFVRDIPSTIICKVTTAPVAGGAAGAVSYRGQIIKARVLDTTLTIVAGDTVLADYLQTAREMVITVKTS